jgi:hypothetical protein
MRSNDNDDQKTIIAATTASSSHVKSEILRGIFDIRAFILDEPLQRQVSANWRAMLNLTLAGKSDQKRHESIFKVYDDCCPDEDSELATLREH